MGGLMVMDIEGAGRAWRAERTSAGVWTLWLDRPGSSQNALGTKNLLELDEHIEAIAADARAARVIVRSAKAKGFCAGADLREIRSMTSKAQVESFAHLGQMVLHRLSCLPVPTLAVVHGACLGGGLELALACKQRYSLSTEVEAMLGTPEVKLGLVPGWGAVGRLAILCGIPLALELLLGGEAIKSDVAFSYGLIDRVVTSDELASAFAPSRLESPSTVYPWPQDWQESIEPARGKLLPGPRLLAQERILAILETELKQGHQAGLEASAVGLAELVFSKEAQEAMSAFFARSVHP
jgi:3-hydroxyacyl-CoA dehydrogenase/enoyl-CoA hydratase/3-hydroxybutyryl-CoA epimerase